MKNFGNINLSNFRFTFSGHGHYKVSYEDKQSNIHTTVTSDMQLIDATKNCEGTPKKKDLIALRELCKSN
jgi:hypothetical protein